jgi:Tol biopolymer transport system component
MLTGESDGLWHHTSPAWSPDGRTICYAAHQDLWVIPARGGAARPLTTDAGHHADPIWSPGGHRIYFTSMLEQTMAIWWVAATGGVPERLTIGSSSEQHPSPSADGSRLAYSTYIVNQEIALLNLTSGTEIRPAELHKSWMPTLAPDGSGVAFISDRWGGGLDLWYLALEDGRPSAGPRRLTDHAGIAAHPAFSRDGAWLAYYRVIDDQRDIWIIPTTGGEARRFTDDVGSDVHPAWSPDGATMVFASDRDGISHIWMARVKDGRRVGAPWKFTSGDMQELAPTWSPDGRFVAFVGAHERSAEVWVLGSDGLDAPRQMTWGAQAVRSRWMGNETLLVSGYWGEGEGSLRRVSLATGEVAAVEPPVSFDVEMTSGADFDVSGDGRFIAYSGETCAGDIWVLEAEAGTY